MLAEGPFHPKSNAHLEFGLHVVMDATKTLSQTSCLISKKKKLCSVGASFIGHPKSERQVLG